MIKPEQITNSVAARISMNIIRKAKKDWYELVKFDAKDKEYNELRAFFKHDCKLYCDIIDIYFKIDSKEDNQGTFYNMQQLLKELEYDRQHGIVREVPDEIL